jgi:hypothetical protein
VTSSLGEQFAKALASKDAVQLKALLAPDLSFRAMTPGKFWESRDSGEVVDEIMLGTWFKPSDDIRALERVDTDSVGPRNRVAYRLRVVNGDGDHLVEQQCYFDDVDGRIAWLRVMCAGYLPADAT